MTMVRLLWGLSVMSPKLLGLGLCGPGGLSREESAFTSQPLRVGRWVLLSKYRWPTPTFGKQTQMLLISLHSGSYQWGSWLLVGLGPGEQGARKSRV